MARLVKRLLGAMLLLPALVHAEIVQRQVITAITAAPAGGDVLSVDDDTGCGGRQLRMDAASLGLSEEQYGVMKAELAKEGEEQTYGNLQASCRLIANSCCFS